MNPETNNYQGQTVETPESRGILGKSAEFKKVLSFPIEASDEEWKKHLEEALTPPAAPASSNVVNPTDTRLQFLANLRTSIISDQRNADLLFMDILQEADDEASPDMMGAIVLTRVADLLNRKRTYESFAKEEKPEQLSMLPLYLSIAASEIAEESVISMLPELPSAETKGRIEKLRATVKAEKRLVVALQKAGIKNVNFARMLSKMPRETRVLVGNLVARATPNSVYDILLMSYYLHESDDKMAAALQFSTFLVAQGLSEVLVETVGSRLAILGKLPKNPYVVAAVALAIVIGLDKAIGFDKIVAAVESRFDPATWDMGGQVVDTVSGSKLFDDVGELGYMSGLRSVDPLKDMKSFLRQKLQMNRGEGAKVEYAHSMLDWNQQVESMAAAAEKQGNPVQASLYRMEMIDHGDWANRQAVLFYGNVEKLRGLQATLNELTSSNVDLIDVVTQPRKDDVEFRRMLQMPMFTSDIQLKITAIQDPEQKKQAQETYESYIQWAQHIVDDVTLYVHLGVYDPRWIQHREALGESSIIPAAVEKGMIAHLKYRSLRRKVLDPASYPQLDSKQFAENMANMYTRNRDPDPWPSITEHPVDWFHRFRKFNGDADRRMIDDVHQHAVLPSFMKDIAAIVGKSPALKAALDPFITVIEENKETVHPTDIQKAVLTALADALPDEYINFYPQYTTFKGYDIVRDAMQPGHSSEEMKALMSAFAIEGPRAQFYSAQNMSYSIDYQLQWNEVSQEWLVKIRPSMVNPNNRGFRYMGLSVTQGTITPPERVMSFGTWAEKHPEAAKKVLPQMAQHRQVHDQFKKTIVAIQERESNGRTQAIESAKAKPGHFMHIPASKDEKAEIRSYMQDGGYFVITDEKDVPAFSARREFTSGIQPSFHSQKPVWIAVHTASGEVKRYSYPTADKEALPLISQALTTPIDGNDEGSLYAVIDCFRYLSYSETDPSRSTRKRLCDALLPLYKQSGTKRDFLLILMKVLAQDMPRSTQVDYILNEDSVVLKVKEYLEKQRKSWENLYPAAKYAVGVPGTWVPDSNRALDDGLRGKIEYICWPDNAGTVYSQTTDGLDCRIHDPYTNAGMPLPGKYFDGVTHFLKDIPDPKTHSYDPSLRSWVPKKPE